VNLTSSASVHSFNCVGSFVGCIRSEGCSDSVVDTTAVLSSYLSRHSYRSLPGNSPHPGTRSGPFFLGAFGSLMHHSHLLPVSGRRGQRKRETSASTSWNSIDSECLACLRVCVCVCVYVCVGTLEPSLRNRC